MAISAGRVEARFEIQGDDKSAKALKAVQGNLRGVRRELGKTTGKADDFAAKFGDAGDEAAGKAGKLSTALSSLGDFAGKSEGAFRHASEAAGAFDDVLTVLPGPIGIAAGAIGGLATVLFLQARAARQAKTQIRQAFGPETTDRLDKMRDGLGVSADAMITYQKALKATDGVAFLLDGKLKKIVADAKAIGEDPSEAIKRFSAEMRASASAAQLLAGEARRLGVEMHNLEAPKGLRSRFAAQAKEMQDTVNKQLKELAKLEKQGVDTSRERTRLTLRRASIVYQLRRAEQEAARQERRDARAEVKRVVAFNARLAAEKRRAARQKRQAATAKRRAADEKRARAEAAAAAKDLASLRREIAAAVAVEATNEQAALGALSAKLRLLRATGAAIADVRAVERDLAAARADAALGAVLREENLGARARDIKIESIRLTHDAELVEIDKRLDKESQAKAKKARENAAMQVQISREAAASALQQSAAEVAKGDDPAGSAFAFLSTTVGEAARQFGTAETAASDAYSKIGAAGAAFVSNERARAGIMAATSAADALRAAGTGSWASAAMFSAAALQYGLVAGGVLGGSGAQAGPARGAAPLSGATASATPTGVAGGRVVNVTFNGVFATKAQTAEALGEVMTSLQGTGI